MIIVPQPVHCTADVVSPSRSQGGHVIASSTSATKSTCFFAEISPGPFQQVLFRAVRAFELSWPELSQYREGSWEVERHSLTTYLVHGQHYRGTQSMPNQSRGLSSRRQGHTFPHCRSGSKCQFPSRSAKGNMAG